MRLVALFAVLCCVGLAAAQSGREGARAAPAVCTASGDPHFKTFDGLFHDYQLIGSVALFNSPTMTLQSQFIHCGGSITNPVTCQRSWTLLLKQEFGSQSVIIKFGRWGSTVDPVILNNNGVVTTFNYKTYTYTNRLTLLDDAFRLYWNATGDRFVVEKNADGYPHPSVYLAASSFQANLPPFYPFSGSTDGLCGKFNGNPADDWTVNGVATKPCGATPKAGDRCNAQITAWGAQFVVTSSNALMNHFHHPYKPFEVLTEHPVSLQVDQTAIDALMKIQFKDIEQISAVKKLCGELTEDSSAFQNCVFDAVALDATNENPTVEFAREFAASNAQAAAAAAVTSNEKYDDSSSSSDDKKALALGLGLGLGCAALVAVAVLGVTFHRYKKLKQQHSQALIALNNVNPSSSSTDAMNVRLTENI